MIIEVARQRDDADLRRLLRSGVMDGRIGLSLEREPSFFAAAASEGCRHETIVARKAEAEAVVAMGSRSTRRRFIGGAPHWVPYLGALRGDIKGRGALRCLRRGFDLCRTLRQPDETPFCLTSIMADNVRARKLLERGLPGLPVYRPLTSQSTLVIPVGRRFGRAAGLDIRPAENFSEVGEFLVEQGRRFDFHPVWDEPELHASQQAGGPCPSDFLICRNNDGVLGCIALWDQRRFRQIVVRNYAKSLRRVRPVLNVAARLAGQPGLPEAGATLAGAFLSHLAVAEDDPTVALRLLDAAGCEARRRKLDWLVIGLAEKHPLIAPIKARYRYQELVNMIYLVCWPEDEDRSLFSSPTTPYLEVATL